MFKLLDDWKLILDALIEAPIAWQSPAELATALGRGVDETTDLLSAMDEAKWLSVWDVEPEPLVTLSTLAAHRLKVALIEVGPEELPRWARAGDPAPPAPKAGEDIALTAHFARQAHLLDPLLPPDDASEDFECRAERAIVARPRLAAPPRVDDLPLPVLLLGQNLTPWPGPGEWNCLEVCPACAGGPLSSYVYCLICDRWGLDAALAKLAPKATTTRSKGPRPSEPATSNGSVSPGRKASGARALRSDGRQPLHDEVSRKRARCNEGGKVLLTTRGKHG